MNVTLQEALKNYLNEHNHTVITLKLVHNDYSSANMNSKMPAITFQAPDVLEDFDTQTVDGFTLYLEKGVVAYDNHLEFVLEKLLGINACHVKGLDLDNVTVM